MKKIFVLFTAFALSNLAWGQTTLIENCENNATLLNTKWYAYPNSTQGKSSTILINGKAVDGIAELETSEAGIGGNGKCMSATGTLAKTYAPDYESAGMGFPFTTSEAILNFDNMVTNSSEVALNLSSAQGIEFYYKSTAGKLVLNVLCTNIKQNAGHDYQIEIPTAADWTKFTLAFPASQLEADGVPVLAQPSWLSPQTPWDGSTVYNLLWQVRDVDGNYTFSVDSISIIGEILPTDVTPNTISQEISGNTIYFTKKSPTTVSVMASSNYFGDIALPSTITFEGITYTITGLDNNAFEGCLNLHSISLPNTITSISDGAFANCTNLTSIAIPNSVTSIGMDAFSNCSNLTSLTLPNSVIDIQNGAFSECKGLTSFTFPYSITKIEGSPFYDCTNIETLVIENPNCNAPDVLTYLSNIQNITAPASSINNAYYQNNLGGITPQLKSVTITSGELTEKGFDNLRLSYRTLESLNLINTSNASIPDVALENCYKLKEVLLPQNLETIGYKSFYECVNIKNITIPNTVISIGDRAFEDCRSMDTLTFGTPLLKTGGSALQTIGNWSFYNCHELKSLSIPEGVTEIGDAAFFSCTYVEQLNLPSSLLKIGDNAFGECENLTNLTILAQTPPQIEAKTFYNVNRLIPVYVPNASTLKYSSDTYWSEFVTYKDAPTGISLVSEELDIKVVNGKIQINNPTNKPLNIYNALGQKVSLENATKGMFIIQIGNQQQKVVL